MDTYYVLVEDIPWRLYRDIYDNFYCDVVVDGSEIIKLKAKNHEDAIKETINYVNSILN